MKISQSIIFVVLVCWSGWLTAVTSSSNYGLCEKGDIMASKGNIFVNSSSVSSKENTTICERTIYASSEGLLELSINQIDLIQGDFLQVFDGVYEGKQINSTSSQGGKIFKTTGNTMRIVVKIQRSGKNNGFSTIKGSFSTLPFPSTCKCSGIQNGFLRCRENDSGERKCTVYCNHGFVDLFNTTGVDYTCDLSSGKWNNGYNDQLGCFSLPLLPDVKTQVNFTIKHLACNDTKDKLFDFFRNYLVTKEPIQQNSLCFKANNIANCFNFSCTNRGNGSFVSTTIRDKATGSWNSSGSETLSKAYNTSLMHFEKSLNESLKKTKPSAAVMKDSLTYKTYTNCPSETFPIGPTSTCSMCPQGSFYKPVKRICEKCPNGTFSSKDLTKCVPEKANNVSQPSKCEIKCLPGKEFNEKTGFCHSCPRNSYKRDSAGNCTLCPNGKMTLRRGSINNNNCYDSCDNGTFFDLSKKTCLPCPLATFQNATKHLFTWCDKCGGGKVTYTTGSKDPSDCAPSCETGHFFDVKSKNCSRCSVGNYQNSTNQIKCLKCPDGTSTLSAGTTNSTDCLKVCQAGTYYSIQNRTCLKCSLGTFMDRNNHLLTSCLNCSKGMTTYTKGVADGAKCYNACKEGQFFNASQSACVNCTVGRYQNGTNQLQCIKCPNGTSTRTSGSSTKADCIKTCSKGTYLDTQEASCKGCPFGTFMDNDGHLREKCQQCAEKKTTYVQNATNSSQCDPVCTVGQYYNQSVMLCKVCAKGSFQDKTGQISCAPCPPGMSTKRAGATSNLECLQIQGKIICNQGEFYNAQNHSCYQCEMGTYQSAVNHTLETCQACLSGRTNEKGAKSNRSCVESCEKSSCKNGGICIAINQTITCKCPQGFMGKYCEVIEKKIVCKQGEFYNAQNHSCYQCEMGTYQSAVNHTLETCQACLSGRTNEKGAKSNSSCVEGSCEKLSCKNGGTCIEPVNQTTTCKCLKGFMGKHCEVVEKTEKKDKDNLQRVESSVRFTSLEWSKYLQDDTSDEYKRISSTIEKAIKKVFAQDSTFVDVKVRRLRSGSVIADFDLYMANNASLVPAQSLQLAVSQGSVGGLSVDSKYLHIRQVTCSKPLGMESGQIKDGNIIGSGQGKGRLNGEPWRAAKLNDALQIQFESTVNVTAVAIQGDGNDSYVISYSLSYSNDGKDWVKYVNTDDRTKMKVYKANNDSSSIVKQVLQQPIASVKFIRVIPILYEKAIAMRVELYGCMTDPVLKVEVAPTEPSQTGKPVKTNPNVQGSQSKNDEYAWGKYLGIAFGVIMAIVVVGACFIWWKRSKKKKKQKEDTPLVLTRYQDGSYREIERNDEEEEDAV